jgi:hypothetical protein
MSVGNVPYRASYRRSKGVPTAYSETQDAVPDRRHDRVRWANAQRTVVAANPTLSRALTCLPRRASFVR